MNRVDFDSITTLLQVADSGGFSAAGRELGVAQSTVSRRIAELEARLGQKLIERTTRRMLLTEAGVRYSTAVRRLLEGIAQAEADLDVPDPTIEGNLRLSIPTGYGRSRILPVLATIALAFPRLRLEIDLSDRYVDLLAEDYDLAIRMSEPEVSGLEAERLGTPVRSLLCAAPEYIRGKGPRSLDELATNHCIVQRTYSARSLWTIVVNGVPRRLSIRPRMIVNDIAAIHLLALHGVGIAVLPDYLVETDLREGRLILPFPDAELVPRPVYIVWPAHKRRLPRLRAVRSLITDTI